MSFFISHPTSFAIARILSAEPRRRRGTKKTRELSKQSFPGKNYLAVVYDSAPLRLSDSALEVAP
jgi:hypothetical protein